MNYAQYTLSLTKLEIANLLGNPSIRNNLNNMILLDLDKYDILKGDINVTRSLFELTSLKTTIDNLGIKVFIFDCNHPDIEVVYLNNSYEIIYIKLSIRLLDTHDLSKYNIPKLLSFLPSTTSLIFRKDSTMYNKISVYNFLEKLYSGILSYD